ncbi:hypothetical protein HDV01_001716 [Terramyces sp. JEL0728]|nr:hypothetical protein HDV01_001716 [Terramyces sp. JEL0728]
MAKDVVTALEYVEEMDRVEKEAQEVLPFDPTICFYNKDKACRIDNTEREENENQYNDNFDGINCYCKQMYDAEKEEDVMQQCLVCEDWFHERCIGMPDQEFNEYICSGCVDKHDFLHCYADQNGYISPPKTGLDTNQCGLPNEKQSLSTKGIFCKEDFRSAFCRCAKCMGYYTDIPFILEIEQSVEPILDNQVDKSSVDLGMEKLNHIDRKRAIDGVIAYNGLKRDLLTFLEKFKGGDKVVEQKDILEFFERKRRKKR